jgi:hypothetical protein
MNARNVAFPLAGNATDSGPSLLELYALIHDLSDRLTRLEARVAASEALTAASPLAAAEPLPPSSLPAPAPAPAEADSEAAITVRLYPLVESEPSPPLAPSSQAALVEALQLPAPQPAAATPLPQLMLDDEEEPPKPVRQGPEKIDVVAALEKYPRILESIEMFWGGMQSKEFLKTLVFDDRGNRAGFPPEVMAELLFLLELAQVKFPSRGADIWEDWAKIR